MISQRNKLCIWLLGINMFISAFTFGGGYVVVPMIRKYFVFRRKLFSEDELVDMAAIAQSSPGAIAINLSTLVGFRVAGVTGAVISCFAAVIPSLVILIFISMFYIAFAANPLITAVLKGMQAGVAALIVDFVVDMSCMVIKERSLPLILMIPTAFLANFIFEINVAIILAVCCILCITRVWLNERRKK
ncbi:chromate transporter [Paenibacillus sp. p3-SID867]|uniref:chromate transporter n=1 Tax=Paenibacillus sp. p3-SID867 TaxID=2916363 RepID=UPI0021A2FFD2|nr:chromate transporter [Paenibacillus sp. p3-SID867]MCT1401096.1 chromate transporter [Paenibacillus sp. p3-SID867]